MTELFTLESAEELLPTLCGLLRRAITLHHELQVLHAQSVVDQEGIEVETDQHSIKYQFELVNNHEALHQLTETFYASIEEIEELGVEIKDLEQGLIDFPYQFEDRAVFLCWKLGEERIAHWHELEVGFSERQEIIEL